MKTATTREVQHHFSRVLDWVEDGEEVVITRRGKQVARVVPIDSGDPFDKNVDWAAALKEREAIYQSVEANGTDSVSRMREMERY